jgi:hypothetical protein
VTVEESATCIYCGTNRPISEELCPNCGRPWIDQWIEEAGVGAVSAGAVAAQLGADAPPTDSSDGPAATTAAAGAASAQRKTSRRPWIIAAVIAVAVMAVYGIVFGIALSDTDSTPTTTGNTIGLASSTTETVAPTTAPTTEAPTTTTSTLFAAIPPVGDPIPIEDLTLGAFSLGPLEFGSSSDEALGRLVASLGQPDDLRDIGEEDGLCPTDVGSEARWGWLTAIFRDDADVDVLVGYRFVPDPDQPDHETNEMATISGATVGDTLEELRAIYDPLPITTKNFEGEPGWILTRLSDERTLLWGYAEGPDDDDLLTTIFAPRPCDGGPFASD